MYRSIQRTGSRRVLLGLAVLLAVLAAPAGATASSASPSAVRPFTTTYTINGYEVWPTAYAATFVGAAQSESGVWGGWRSRIEHSGVISPSGWISGGYAELFSGDLTTVRGTFAGGTVTLIGGSEYECVTLTHAVEGTLVNVVRSDRSATGVGSLSATLTHHRAWIFGRCLTYSASAVGTISVTF